MDVTDILNALAIGENSDWEFKSARGGLPKSLWETYSAMANTDGGVIVLGIKEKNNCLVIDGLDDPGKIRADFWSTVNDRGKVSASLLSEQQVSVKEVAGKQLLVVCVPSANRRQRPIYVGQNPLRGTYRRNFDGDFHCTEQEVRRMLADSSDEPADSRILEHFGINDLDPKSLDQYRQRFSARSPDHPWLREPIEGFLRKLQAWRRDRATGREGLTVAGLLMFGKDEAIRDSEAVPQFHLDYQEKLSDDPDIRWTDRVTFDGTWVCNVFQFYQRVIPRLTTDLKLPFQLAPNLFRRDDTIVHEAVREAVVNALIHADYFGQGGVVIEKFRDRLVLSNPGTLLVSREQFWEGSVSECRNKILQTLFFMIGGGEKAGSGVDKIRRSWHSQHWRSPRFRTPAQPDRFILLLPMTSLLPEESLQRLHNRFGAVFDSLKPVEVQSLVTADIEGEVCNARLQEVSGEHPADITRLLQGLVSRKMLVQKGQKRGASYCIPFAVLPDKPESVPVLPGFEEFPPRAPDSLHKPEDSPHKPENSLHKSEDSPHKPESDPVLLEIAAPARQRRRLPPPETEGIIEQLCTGHYLTAKQLGALLNRKYQNLQNRFLNPMLQRGVLKLKYPNERNRPDQAYTSGDPADARE